MSTQQHKALLLHSAGAPFKVDLRPTPTPGPNQLLIHNHALALNPADWIIGKTGFLLGQYGWPIVLGQDGAGSIAALGSDVRGWSVGDRVLYQSYFTPDRGTFQEYTIAEADLVARVPENVTVEQAASVPLTLATAAIGMYEGKSERLMGDGQDVGGAGLIAPWEVGGRGKYAGKAVLVLGGASSVGQYVIQFAKLSGFSPIITTASGHNEAYCKAAGATHVLDYSDVPNSELPKAVASIIGETPLTFVYNSTSDVESQKVGWDLLGQDGTLVIVNPVSEALKGKQGKEDENGRRLVWVFGVATDPDHHEFGKGLYAALTEMLEKGEIKPNKVENIGHGLEAIPAGLERLQKGRRGVTLPNSVEDLNQGGLEKEKPVSGVKLVVTL